jgi:hypothetical protein
MLRREFPVQTTITCNSVLCRYREANQSASRDRAAGCPREVSSVAAVKWSACQRNGGCNRDRPCVEELGVFETSQDSVVEVIGCLGSMLGVALDGGCRWMEDAIRIVGKRVEEASNESQCRVQRQLGGATSRCSYALRCIEAQSEIEQWSDARIDDLIMDIGSIAARSEDSECRQPSQLIGDRLRFHLEGSRHVGYTEFT